MHRIAKIYELTGQCPEFDKRGDLWRVYLPVPYAISREGEDLGTIVDELLTVVAAFPRSKFRGWKNKDFELTPKEFFDELLKEAHEHPENKS